MDVNQTYGDPFRCIHIYIYTYIYTYIYIYIYTYTYIEQLCWIPEANITPIIPQ